MYNTYVDYITFATTNESKLSEAKAILGIEVRGESLDIAEIQSLDFKEVAKQKALTYFEKLNRPIFAEDVSLTFNALKGLPGTYIDDFSKALGNEEMCKILSHKRDRTAVARTTLAYTEDGQNVEFFIGELNGIIAKYPRGEKGFGWDPIFIPDGDNRTFAELEPEEKNAISMRKKALEKFKTWLQENNK